jgi:N-carbamoyl-L-amino-acid hydrolase
MAAPGENLKINGERLWDSLMEMAKIGPGIAGGNNRQTLTDEDSEGRRTVPEMVREAGMTMGVDEIGNMFARREGRTPMRCRSTWARISTPSPRAGSMTGFWACWGLEIIRTLNDLDIKTKHPIVVTNWTNEEGTRYAPAMLASGVFAGKHTLDWAYDRVDANGQALRR